MGAQNYFQRLSRLNLARSLDYYSFTLFNSFLTGVTFDTCKHEKFGPAGGLCIVISFENIAFSLFFSIL